MPKVFCPICGSDDIDIEYHVKDYFGCRNCWYSRDKQNFIAHTEKRTAEITKDFELLESEQEIYIKVMRRFLLALYQVDNELYDKVRNAVDHTGTFRFIFNGLTPEQFFKPVETAIEKAKEEFKS